MPTGNSLTCFRRDFISRLLSRQSSSSMNDASVKPWRRAYMYKTKTLKQKQLICCLFYICICFSCCKWLHLSCCYWHTECSKSSMLHAPTHCTSTTNGPLIVILTPVSVVGNDSQSKAWFSESSERDQEETRYLATVVAVSYSRCNLKKVAPCELSGCFAIWNPVILVFQENCEEQKDAEHTQCVWALKAKEKQLVVSFKV